MFSLDSFYNVISKNLLEPLLVNHYYFEPFGSTKEQDLQAGYENKSNLTNLVIFHDQEPINVFQLKKILAYFELTQCLHTHYAGMGKIMYGQHKFLLLANSEISLDKKTTLNNIDFYDWYYFYHGFAALDWFKNIKYLPPITSYSKLFISFNNLFNGNRNYRLIFIAKLMDKNLHNFGLISLNQVDTAHKIKQEIFSNDSVLSKENKKLIYKQLYNNTSQFVIDQKISQGILSANDNLETLSQGLFHIVTETIFYENKLHLTEKIFKPIVARRPFILLCAPHNLNYLKKYGFKTFEQWIDESYDSEPDHNRRIEMVVTEIEKLARLSDNELNKMYLEMQEVLNYNFNWFYTGFKEKIVHELVDNFDSAVRQYNLNKMNSSDNYLDCSTLDFENIKKRLIL